MITTSSSQDFCPGGSVQNLAKIPKINTVSNELLQTIDETNQTEYEIINNSIKNSHFDKKNCHLGHSLTQIQLINNKDLEERYMTKKQAKKEASDKLYKNLRKTTKSSNKRLAKKEVLTEKTLFFICNDESHAIDIANNGLKCEESEYNYLGDSGRGIHLGKHIDIMLKHECIKRKRSKQLFCILVKAFYNIDNLKVVPPTNDNKLMGASPGHDGHVPLIRLEGTFNLISLYRQQFIFLYGCDEWTQQYENIPANILPYAILKYELKNPYETSRKLINKHQQFASIRSAFSNQTRYFNQIQNSQEASIPFSNNRTNEFKQSDFIPLFGETINSKIDTSIVKKPTEYDLFIENARKQQESAQDDIEPEACRLVKNFRPMSPPPPSANKKQSIYSDDDDSDDELDLLEEYFREYADRFNECSEKMPKWRVIYERTGNVDTIFRASRRMECKLNNIKQLSLKYTDEDKTVINVNESTNKLILTYESKRIKKAVTTSSSDESIKSLQQNINESDEKVISRLRISKNCFVNVDFSYIPTSDKTDDQIVTKNENIETESSVKLVQAIKTAQVTKPIVNKQQPIDKKTQLNVPKTTTPPINKNKTDSLSIKPNTERKDLAQKPKQNQLSKKEATDKILAKLASNLTKPKESNPMIKVEKTELDLTKKTTNSLSSDNTSLEKRLLGIDKSKPINKTPTIKQEPIVPQKPVESQPKPAANFLAQPPSNIKEELKKVLEKYRNKPVPKPETITEPKQKVDKSKQLIESIKSSAKRKKSFWDPDSDSEYDKICSDLPHREDDEDFDDDIVIVSKQNLNLPPIQYSKQFYDSNMNGLDAELKKFTPNSSCSSSPLNNSLLNNTNNTVTTITKSPIKSKNKNHLIQQQQRRHLNNYRLANNRQRFIHHIVVNNINTMEPFNQFDVDSLKNLKTNQSQLSLNCIEIHAGGFRCIEVHNFQQSANYLRRTKSFETRKLPYDSSFSKTVSFSNTNELSDNSAKKISLNDYVNNRSKSVTTTPVTSTMISNNNSNDSQPTTSIKREAVSPPKEAIQPLRQSIESTVLPPFNKNVQQLPSLSLIDELKKRINSNKNDKKDDKSIYSNQRLIKEDDLYDDDELKLLQTEHSKLKRSTKKKHDKSKKKIKMSPSGTVLSSSQLLSSSSNLSSDSLNLNDSEDSMSSFTSASLSSELLLTDDNLTMTDSSLSSFSLSSTSSSDKKKKKKHSKKRKITSSDDADATLIKKSKRTKNDKRKSSKKSKRKDEEHTNSSFNLMSDLKNQNSNSYSTKLLTTNDEDYSIGEINMDVFEREVSKNLADDKSTQDTKTSETISDNKEQSDHSNKIDKPNENYENFYSEYDIDDAAIFSTGLPSISTDSIVPIVVNPLIIEPKLEAKSPVKGTIQTPIKIEPIQTPIKIEPIQPSPTFSIKQPTPRPSPVNSAPLIITQSPIVNNMITTPKTAPASLNRFTKQNYHMKNQPYKAKQQMNSLTPNQPSFNNKMHLQNRARPDFSNQMMSNSVEFNNIHGLDISPSLMPNMNYIQPNYDPMAYGNPNQAQQYNQNYHNYDDVDYQYNNNYQYPKNNPTNNNFQYSNNNYAWQANTTNSKDKYNNFNQNFNQRNHQRSFNPRNNQQNRRDLPNLNQTRLNNNNTSSNKRAQNPDQEDGEIVD